jgi:hypothetical protein
MKRIVLSLVVLGLVALGVAGIVPGFPPQVGVQPMVQAATEHTITVDIAMDGRTWRFNNGITYQEAGRGDSFMVFGPMYPAGTLPTGTASNSPDDPGSIGTWTYSATFGFDGGVSLGSGLEACCGVPPVEIPPLWIQARRGRPGVVDLFKQLGVGTQYHQFDHGGTLVSEGIAMLPRAANTVVGGMGAFSGARGEMAAVAISTNSTGFPNLRMTFKLKKDAPK